MATAINLRLFYNGENNRQRFRSQKLLKNTTYREYMLYPYNLYKYIHICMPQYILTTTTSIYISIYIYIVLLKHINTHIYYYHTYICEILHLLNVNTVICVYV